MAVSIHAPMEGPFPLLFVMAGLRRASRSWREYEIGKKLLREMPEEEYEEGIKALSKFLCI